MAFAPSGHWLATTHGVDVAFWPLGTPRPQVLRMPTATISILFTPDGSRVLSLGADRSVKSWPLTGDGETRVVMSHSPQTASLQNMAMDPSGRMLALSGAGGWLSILRVDDGSVQRLRGIPESVGVGGAAFGEDGRLLAAGILAGPGKAKVVPV